jgi:putative phosphoribosyl transferase
MFADRVDAGRQLSRRAMHLRGPDVVVLGLPRGGVPVAFEVARALDAPLDVIVVRKLGVPDQPELGMGAIGEGGVRITNSSVLRTARVGADELAGVEAREQNMLAQRTRVLRGDRPALALDGRTAVIVDDGVATGSTARAACQVARARGASRVILAVPVAAADAAEALRGDADEVVCVLTPQWLSAIGAWYEDFAPTSDADVRELLARAGQVDAVGSRPDPSPRSDASERGIDEEIVADPGGLALPGHLILPDGATAIVLFVHGSGSGRRSPRNRYVASVLNAAGLGTLLFDLLTRDEEADRANVFDIGLLAGRLARVTAWLRAQPWGAGLHIGWFGASTGAGAALWAAAEPDATVSAIVSRGGRPDLADARLAEVRAPTLLIVGGRDTVVLSLNRSAQASLRCPNDLAVVPGATHLFEEPGTLSAAAGLARDWFTDHLRPTTHAYPSSRQAG